MRLTEPREGTYYLEDGSTIHRAPNVPDRWVAFWPDDLPLRDGDADNCRSYFLSPEKALEALNAGRDLPCTKVTVTSREYDAQEVAGLTIIQSTPHHGKSKLQIIAFGSGEIGELMISYAAAFRNHLRNQERFEFPEDAAG